MEWNKPRWAQNVQFLNQWELMLPAQGPQGIKTWVPNGTGKNNN